MRSPSAIALLLLAAQVQAAEPMHLLIFSGGKTEADAKRALESFNRLKPVLGKAVSLPPDQPRIVESSKLPGLKAGFWVLTLGRCHEPAAALSAIKAVYPGAYSKPLTGETRTEACPVVSDPEGVVALEATPKLAGRALNAFSVTETSKDNRGNELSTTTFHFVLVDKASGQVLDLAETSGGGVSGAGSEGPGGAEFETCSGTVRANKAAFTVVRDCRSGRTSCGYNESAIPTAWSERLQVTVAADKLVVSEAVRVVTAKSDCVVGNDGEGD